MAPVDEDTLRYWTGTRYRAPDFTPTAMLVINTLSPLFLIVAAGVILRRSGFVGAEFFKVGSRLVYWVALPCLLFEKTAASSGGGDEAMRVCLMLAAGMAACVIVAYLVGWILRLERPSLAAFVQGGYRGNLAYVGLPVVLFSMAGATGQPTGKMEAFAVLAIAPLVPVYNVLAVVVLLAGQKRDGSAVAGRVGRILVGTLTNPLLLSCAAGLAWSMTGRALPAVVARTCATIGYMALPLVLMGLGASLTLKAVRGTFVPAFASATIKVAVGPIAGYLVGRQLGLTAGELRVGLLYLACPTAVVSFVMAEQLNSDSRLTASIIVLATFLSIPALAVVLLLA